jgi:hypothetical protein
MEEGAVIRALCARIEFSPTWRDDTPNKVRPVRSTNGISSCSRKSRNATAPPELASCGVLVGVKSRARSAIVGGTMAHIDDDHRAHPLRIDVVLLNERHERELPAIQNLQHRIGLARLRIACRQGNEEFVPLPDPCGCQRALLSVGKAYRRLGCLRPRNNRSQKEKQDASRRHDPPIINRPRHPNEGHIFELRPVCRPYVQYLELLYISTEKAALTRAGSRRLKN